MKNKLFAKRFTVNSLSDRIFLFLSVKNKDHNVLKTQVINR